jgi:phosphonate transport system substrate-binding protein
MEPLRVGAVAYDPKVVTIWEGISSYLKDEARVPAEVELFLSYPAQVAALLAGRIDIAWNTNLAYLQCEAWSSGACRPVGMRDTDLGWTSHVIAPKGSEVRSVRDLRGRSLALGSRDSGQAAILPVFFLKREGLLETKDYRSLRFDTDAGKHGDTGTSEVEVLKAVLDGRVDAGAVSDPFWKGVGAKGLVPPGALEIVWTSPGYSHCMFTGRPGLPAAASAAFLKGLRGMQYANPAHRAILDAEGLREWLPPHAEGYDDLRTAMREQGFIDHPPPGAGRSLVA